MKRFKNILYAAHPGGDGEAFDHAVALARRNDADLTVLWVLEPVPHYLDRLTPLTLEQARRNEAEAELEKLVERTSGRVKIETKIEEGKPFLEIIREVLRHGRDLVIKSAEGSGAGLSRLFGTTDMHLLRKCPCPVWLVKSAEAGPLRQIMAPVDFGELDAVSKDSADPLNRMILEMAGSLAHQQGSACHVVHAWEAVGEDLMRSKRTGIDEEEVKAFLKEVRLEHRNWLDRLMRKARKWIGAEMFDALEVTTHLPKGSAKSVIPKMARKLKIDLIVMGTVARTGIPGFFVGNTAEGILTAIDCSVLAVKPPGFVTPVTLESAS